MRTSILTGAFILIQLWSGQLLAADLQIPQWVKVNDGIARGGRPPLGDIKTLADLGYKTIINLENDASAVRAEQKAAVAAGLQFYSFPTSPWETPKDRAVDEILDLLQDPSHFPIFIHCEHGQDRTGMIMGLYRFEVDKWSAQKAYDEMLDLGFHPILFLLDRYYKRRTGL